MSAYNVHFMNLNFFTKNRVTLYYLCPCQLVVETLTLATDIFRTL